MKKTSIMLLFVALNTAATLAVGQTNPVLKPPVKIRVRIATEESGCKHGIGLCFIRIYSDRSALAGISEAGGKEFLCIQREGLSDQVSDELSSAAQFSFTRDLEVEEEYARALGYSGTFTLIRGTYPIEIQDDYFVIPIKTKHE